MRAAGGITTERLGLAAYDTNATDLGTYKSLDGKRLDWILISSQLEFVEYDESCMSIGQKYWRFL